MVPLLEYQREDVDSGDRFRWNCWSRQSGKSFTKSLRRILRGLRRRRTQVFLSAGERQSRELMQKARQHCQALKIATDFYDDRCFEDLGIRQLEITLPGGVRIIGLPANPQTARGYTGDVFLDEFAMHAMDRDIWAAMFPTLLRGDGELDVASTPKGKGNVFYQLRDNERFSQSTVTLDDAIGQGLDVDAEEVRKAMDDDALFRQEFLCEFLDESTAFLTYDQIAACADPTLQLHDSVGALSGETRELFAGVDVGRVRDLTVVWVVAADGEALSTAAIFELSNTPFRAQFELLAELLSLRKLRRCCIDAGGLGMQLAEEAVERFGQHRVEAITFTPALKSQIAAGLRITVESRKLRIPNDERIRNDWHGVERT
ncbi:MAG: terminase family protein, partial [Phycisphaerae bacterium]